ncbi:conserved hypothetical protein [Bathymodiolus platifrons methanotrophic gill symbiont]|uniref:hypothetical protein n=2 Tax=Bathymodiolus platifrons methanotrophic gill symbiont TaxID=113268 RepID=UPI000B6C1CF2|nr:hypothetical protein [Bathymodiolus platifrons methanotrophic gill symbiont]GAW86394.1 conserved hypothetical protein [Bathymodiolus platifrons methanotrophic gill symbiont]GFO75929.1 hypothetical protein BPLS_P3420 [Bathymodiolus platifrons methanotrophic gill symbiont]
MKKKGVLNMGKERTGLGIEEIDPEDTLDLEEVISSSKGHSRSNASEAEIKTASEKAGFPSRQPRSKRVRPKSPYTVQSNLKTRAGVKELFQEIGARLEIFDQETFERALVALLEKEKMKDLEKEFRGLIK